MRLDIDLAPLSDSRTSAGVDVIPTFHKMTVFEREGDRVMALLTANNLAISQAVHQVLTKTRGKPCSLWMMHGMFEAAAIVGEAMCGVYDRNVVALVKAKIDFNVSIIFDEQANEERSRPLNVYVVGNFIEATPGNCYLQAGEAKYGKPTIDRVVSPGLPLDEAAKYALILMDSTLGSNISMGLPLDLLVYEADSLQATRFIVIDEGNPYLAMICGMQGKRLRQTFVEIDDPDQEADTSPARPLCCEGHPSTEVGSARIAPFAAKAPATPDRAPGPALGQMPVIQRVVDESQKSR